MNAPTTQVLDSLSSLWGLALQPAGCRVCRQVFLLHPGQQNLVCPMCGQAALQPQPAWLRPAAQASPMSRPRHTGAEKPTTAQ